jgi:FOG: FHA domain
MDLVKCPFCGKEIENDSFYCDQCGEELKICPRGHGFRKGKVCGECGVGLIEAKNASNGQAAPAEPKPATTQSSSPQPQPTEPQVSVQQPVSVQQSPPISQADSPAKTVRPEVVAEPKFLVSNALNARLDLKDGAIIGRRAGDYTHVFGNQGYVSGSHARLQKNMSGAWEIVDLDSSNGTFLNGQKLVANQPVAIKIGDTVAFYDLTFIVNS